MDNLRIEEIRRHWDRESENPESMEWRNDLTPEELDYVTAMDKSYRSGMLAMASAILVREKVHAQFSPREILELETVRDHCRLRLRDGRLFLARLDRDRNLRLDEIDGVC